MLRWELDLAGQDCVDVAVRFSFSVVASRAVKFHEHPQKQSLSAANPCNYSGTNGSHVDFPNWL